MTDILLKPSARQHRSVVRYVSGDALVSKHRCRVSKRVDWGSCVFVSVQCLKYATDQQADLKRMEELNNTFFRLMARGPEATGDPRAAPPPVAHRLPRPAGCHAAQHWRLVCCAFVEIF